MRSCSFTPLPAARWRGPRGGAEAELLRCAGHEVEQLIADNPVSAARRRRCSHSPTWAQAVRRAIVAFRPDVAHLHNTWYAMSPSVVEELRRAQVPVVVTVRNYRLACLNSYFLRDGRPCEDCLGGLPGPASSIAATTTRCSPRLPRRRPSSTTGAEERGAASRCSWHPQRSCVTGSWRAVFPRPGSG